MNIWEIPWTSRKMLDIMKSNTMNYHWHTRESMSIYVSGNHRNPFERYWQIVNNFENQQNLWNSLSIFENHRRQLWTSMEYNEIKRKRMGIQEKSRMTIKLHGNPWKLIRSWRSNQFDDMEWTSIKIDGYQWMSIKEHSGAQCGGQSMKMGAQLWCCIKPTPIKTGITPLHIKRTTKGLKLLSPLPSLILSLNL